MKFLRLLIKHLLRNKRRSLLTVSSIAVSLFLVATLETILTELNNTPQAPDSALRFVTRHKIPLFNALPIAHREKIAGVEGVDGVVGSMWFGGIYKEPSNFFANFAVTADALFENSNFPTKTETEKAFLLSFVSMLGDIQLFITAIITVVVFTIVLMAANTMAMSIRERVRVNVKVLRPDEYLRPEMSVRVTFLERENSGG